MKKPATKVLNDRTGPVATEHIYSRLSFFNKNFSSKVQSETAKCVGLFQMTVNTIFDNKNDADIHSQTT